MNLAPFTPRRPLPKSPMTTASPPPALPPSCPRPCVTPPPRRAGPVGRGRRPWSTPRFGGAMSSAGSAASVILQVVGQGRHLVGGIDPAARVLGGPLQARRVHRGVEVLGVVRHGADVRHREADGFPGACRVESGPVPSGLAGVEAGAV